jgi:hypothetical protein
MRFPEGLQPVGIGIHGAHQIYPLDLAKAFDVEPGHAAGSEKQ